MTGMEMMAKPSYNFIGNLDLEMQEMSVLCHSLSCVFFVSRIISEDQIRTTSDLKTDRLIFLFEMLSF
ncbi:hypothetical protein JOD43_002781 [Pullulanibacillus pueri]|nr:hypothetical protein [Pullulanibacillus pueri]